MHGLIPAVIAVDDEIEVIAVLRDHRDELLAALTAASVIVHQIHVAIRSKRTLRLGRGIRCCIFSICLIRRISFCIYCRSAIRRILCVIRQFTWVPRSQFYAN